MTAATDPILAPGVITARTSATPGLRDTIKYAARSVGLSQYAVSQATPVNSPVPPGNSLVNVVPAAVGDPCILIRVGGVTRLVALTERVEYAQCQS